MAISISDIEFFLSGGSTNSNPGNSLGGPPSGFLLLGSANNLFSDVSSETASAGRTDYRCFYIANGSSADSLYEAEIYLEEQGSGGSAVSLGIRNSTDKQKISIVGPAYFGSLKLRYDSTEFTAQWGTSPEQFRTSLQEQMSIVAPGSTVQLEVQGNKYYLTIIFSGDSDNRSHPLLEVMENNLLAPDTPIVSILKVAAGSPLNSLAPSIAVETVPPSGVVFYQADESSKLSIGTLRPGDKVPVWIKRATPAGTDYVENDYFKFRITGRPF